MQWSYENPKKNRFHILKETNGSEMSRYVSASPISAGVVKELDEVVAGYNAGGHVEGGLVEKTVPLAKPRVAR